MNRKSRYKIIIDFDKSKNSYIYDKSRKKFFLDFFGQYSTLAIGYNNKIFNTKDFIKEMKIVSKQKIVNNEILSSETKEFNTIFKNFTSNSKFSKFHYTCTGALAVESAIKTAIDYKKIKNPYILSFKGSFHGINSYGGIISDRIGGVKKRLQGFPGAYWGLFNNPIIKYKNNLPNYNLNQIDKVISEIKIFLQSNNNVACIIIEPIQCTNGDNYFHNSFFIKLREICNNFDIPLIFDEIQTGFCVSGKKWYYQHLNIEPDILIFGKKTQLSGIMVKDKFSKIFKKPIRLEVTWDGDVVDMIRCKHIIKAIKEQKAMENVNKMSKFFIEGLKNIKNINNIRNSGLLIAFDLSSKNKQLDFANKIFKYGLLCNPTAQKTIRFRPNLLVNENEISNALNIIEISAKKVL